MSKISLFYCLFFGLLAQIGWGNSLLSSVATQEEIDQDGFLQSTARNLKQSDIVLTVIIYKVVKTDQGTTHYARVIQSLRGDIPVEALIKWSGYANKLPVGTPEKTELYSGCIPVYVLASSKNVKNLGKASEDFKPASSIYSSQELLGAYDLGSDPGRAMKKLLRIEPAKITEESEAARFQPESGE